MYGYLPFSSCKSLSLFIGAFLVREETLFYLKILFYFLFFLVREETLFYLKVV